MLKKSIYIITILFFVSVCYSQIDLKIYPPAIKGNSSFAIFVDSKTYSKIGKSIDEYKNSIESKKLPCYIVCANWSKPDEVRTEIIKLYNSKPKLEGVVLVGDIPVPMIRDAQHYTSAFKMDQKKFPFKKSSVPSDRFYDDFDLNFKFLSQDSSDKLLNYYSLLSTSSPVIEKEIYSARVKPTCKGDEKYEQMEKFFKKAVRVKKEKNILNKFIFGLGEGYVSDAQDAFISEILCYNEAFTATQKGDGLFYKTFHLTDRKMKNNFLRNLSEIKDLDLSLLTAHGTPTSQLIFYVKPKDSTKEAEEEAEKLTNLLVEDIRNQQISSRVNINNSCFNGAIINYPYLAGEYIFSEGNCVITRANSVNVLQDIWTLENAGMLAEGISVGKWHRVSNSYLESHLFGDPTFSFDAPKNLDLEFVMSSHTKSDLNKLKNIAQKSSLPIARALALVEIEKLSGKESASFLRDIFKKDNSADVRTKALSLLARIKGTEFEEVIKTGSADPNEFIRRVSVKLLGEVGKKEYIPLLLNSMAMDPSERVTSSAQTSLEKIDPKEAYEQGKNLILADKKYQQDSLFIRRIEWSLKYKANSKEKELIPTLLDKTAKRRMTELRSLRGNRFDEAPEHLVKFISDATEDPEIRITAAEAIGWYYFNYDIETFIPKLEEVVNSKDISGELRETLIMTLKRLKTGPNYTLTP